MAEPMIRGYVVLHTARFMRTESDEVTARRLDGELSLELRLALEEMSPAAWYPRYYQVELLHKFAAMKGSSDATYTELQRCGATLHTTAGNEFTALLMKVLTPELFLKKASRLWTRDHRNSGSCELESLDPDRRQGRLRLRDVAGYNHTSIVWLGWIQSVLGELTGRKPSATQTGWSWANPGPAEVTYEVSWS